MLKQVANALTKWANTLKITNLKPNNLLKHISAFNKMDMDNKEVPATTVASGDQSEKRPAEDAATPNVAKKQRTDEAKPRLLLLGQQPDKERSRKKKVAMLLVYSGKGYQGMQRNPGQRTIESDLMTALAKAGVITHEQAEKPGESMQFQRAARTDKGVSAVGQIVSLKMILDVENPVEKINENLADQIRIIAIKRVTKKYDSKNAASARSYMYVVPTFAFTPLKQIVKEDFRVTPEILKEVDDILQLYKGTHNFHNFTSGKKANDPSARRYIMDFKVGEPFEREGREFVVITVRGQSFVLHQIRKMIGLAIAVARGLTTKDSIQTAYGKEKFDVPKAPGLGLVLDQVHYDYYNKKFGNDGQHEPLTWDDHKDKIDAFKEKWIYPTIIETEREEKSMLRWMSTLHLHNFATFDPSMEPPRIRTALAQARQLVQPAKPQDQHAGESPQTAEVAVKTTDDQEASGESQGPTADTTQTVSACDSAAPSGDEPSSEGMVATQELR